MAASVPPQGAPIDRYVVLEYLSEGGMGAIYLGKKLGAGGFEKEVVLKQLLPEFTQQPEFIDLFLREARLSATLDHANIIHTIDLVTAGAEHFIVMEYLAGADLRTLLKKIKRGRRRFSAAAGLYIAREVLSALAYAHSKLGPDGRPLRLIHRDVSPSNILISQNGEVKLTDFGIAKASTHNSVFYRVKGKIGYMSPEQAKNDVLDHRSDLYSLAVCLYEVITGERLFVHAGITSSPDVIYKQPIPLPSRKVPGMPADVDKLMLKALAIDPDARFQSAGEFQEGVLRVAHRNGMMMSAPEMAAHLREVCGPADQWRTLETTRQPTHTLGLGGGTEVLDQGQGQAEGTDLLDLDELDGDSGLSGVLADEEESEPELISVVYDERSAVNLAASGALGTAALPRRRSQTTMRALSRLQGLELTSMINLAAAERAGAEPLVDLDHLGELEERSASRLVPPPSAQARAKPPAKVRAPAPPARGDSQSGIEVLPVGPGTTGESAVVARPDRDRDPRDSAAVSRVDVSAVRRRSRVKATLAVCIIVLAGAGAALAIGLSGPKLEAKKPRREAAPSGSGTGSASGSAAGSTTDAGSTPGSK
jgi:hypothetical protein